VVWCGEGRGGRGSQSAAYEKNGRGTERDGTAEPDALTWGSGQRAAGQGEPCRVRCDAVRACLLARVALGGVGT
jgi:hypothetical protein